jgi:DNA polymerase
MEINAGKREKLKEFYFKIKDCSKCSLGATRTNFVFGSGNSNASVIFIGEAPGKNEDLQGKPFVGQAGKLLDELLGSIGFSRSDVFIANVLKCRPPQNRDPVISEINLCKDYLFDQIDIIDPGIICTMGKYSTQLILQTMQGISTLRGKVFKIGNRIVIPINHPAAALYTPSRLQILKEDFRLIKTIYGNLDDPGKAVEIFNLAPQNTTVPAGALQFRTILDTENSKNLVQTPASREAQASSEDLITGQATVEENLGEPEDKQQAPSQDRNKQLGLF